MEDKMDGTCINSINEAQVQSMQNLIDLKEREHLSDLRVEGMTILKHIANKQEEMLRTGSQSLTFWRRNYFF